MTEQVLRLAIPAGSLQEATIALFRKAGYNLTPERRSYYLSVDDPEIVCTLIRAQEIPRYVQDGLMDAGLTGLDMIQENDASVVVVGELTHSKVSRRPVRWVLAVPDGSPIQSVRELEGKRVATEAVNITKRFLEEHGVKAIVEFSWGATEAKPPELADAIVDVTETGSSLRANGLRIIATIMESTPRFIASHAAWDDAWKRRKIEDMVLMLNVKPADPQSVLSILPALKNPTISSLADAEWVAINTVIDESVVRHIIPLLKQAGAQGIVEYPLNKIIE